jgi:hypothetical protein
MLGVSRLYLGFSFLASFAGSYPVTFVDFGLNSLGSVMEMQCFEPITFGFAVLMVLFGIVGMIILGVFAGTITLATVIIANGRHALTVRTLLIILGIFIIAQIAVPWVCDRWFSDHLRPPDK